MSRRFFRFQNFLDFLARQGRTTHKVLSQNRLRIEELEDRVAPSASVLLSLTGPLTLAAGSNVTYAVTLSNNGPDDAQNVGLSDFLPTGVTFVAQSQPSGPPFTLSNTGNQVSDTIATLPADSSAVIDLVALVASDMAGGSAVLNAASVTTTTALSGDSITSATTSATTPATTPAANSVTSLTSAPGSSVYGRPVTFTATVAPSSGTGIPTGTVTFLDGSTSLGSAMLGANGMATFSTAALVVGGHMIAASYSGDNTFAGSSAMGSAIVDPATPVVAVSDASGAFDSAAYSATATVAGVDGVAGSALEGVGLSLTYYAGTSASGVPLPQAPIDAGTYTVVASFPGSADYTSASAQITFQIVQVTLDTPDPQWNYDSDTVNLPLTATSTPSLPMSYAATGLPPGLSIDPSTELVSGTISPTADANGDSPYYTADATSPYYTVTVSATAADANSSNAVSVTTTQTFIWVVQPVVSLENPGDQSNFAGDAVGVQLGTFSEGNAPITYSTSGLPAGLFVDPSFGMIEGNIANDAGVQSPYQVTVTATADGVSASQTFTWTVIPPVVTLIDPGHQTEGEGQAVSLALTGTDSAGHGLTYSASNLPPGLYLLPYTNIISGVAYGAASGSPYSVTITATDTWDPDVSASQTFTWTVTAPVVTLVDPGDQTDGEGQAVSLALTGTDSAGNGLTYSASNLLPGLSLDPDTGIISGTIRCAAASSPYSVTVTATDTWDPDASASQTFTWTVNPPVVTLVDPGDQTDAVGQTVSLALTGIDSAGNYGLIYSASNLPPGLSLDSYTDIISGVAYGAAGSPYSVTITATDTMDPDVSASQSFTWTVTAPVVTLVDPVYQTDSEGQTVSLALTGTDLAGHGLTYSASNLPPGLSLDPGTGIISGTIPAGAAAGNPYSVTITATDTMDPDFSASLTFVWMVFPPVVTLVPPGDQIDGEGQTVSLALMGTDSAGNGLLTYSASNLPPGLVLDPNTGIVSGTIPSGAAAGGPYSVTITATDTTDPDVSATLNFLWIVNVGTESTGSPTPTIVVTDIGGFYTGSAYPATVSVTDGNGNPVSGTIVLTYSDFMGNVLSSAPVDVGNYIVTADFTSSDPNYTNASAYAEFGIGENRVDPDLSALYQEYVNYESANNGSGAGFEPAADMLEVSDGMVELQAFAPNRASVGALASELTNLGATDVLATDAPFVEVDAMLPIANIPDLASMPYDMDFVDPVQMGMVSTGPVATQGVQAIQANLINQDLTGGGQTVGVLSDSFNTSGNGNYVADQKSGALPGPNNPITGQSTPVNVLEDASGGTDEGRAMLQVVHAVAPGANLAFATGLGGDYNFQNNIKQLAAAGATVIVDDLTQYDDPFFQDGVVAQEVNAVTNAGVAYFSSAGNFANQSYQANFSAGPALAAGAIPSSDQYITFQGGYPQEFAAGQDYQLFTLAAGASVTLDFQWVAQGGYLSADDPDTQSVMNAYLVDASRQR